MLLASFLGALDGVLGFFLDFEIAPEALIGRGAATYWVLCGLVLSFLAAGDGLEGFWGPSGVASNCSWGPPGTSFGALTCDLEFPNWPYELLTND